MIVELFCYDTGEIWYLKSINPFEVSTARSEALEVDDPGVAEKAEKIAAIQLDCKIQSILREA